MSSATCPWPWTLRFMVTQILNLHSWLDLRLSTLPWTSLVIWTIANPVYHHWTWVFPVTEPNLARVLHSVSETSDTHHSWCHPQLLAHLSLWRKGSSHQPLLLPAQNKHSIILVFKKKSSWCEVTSFPKVPECHRVSFAAAHVSECDDGTGEQTGLMSDQQ